MHAGVEKAWSAMPIPFAQAFGRESYAIDLPAMNDAEPVGIVAHPALSSLARVLEHVGLITLGTALVAWL